VRLSDLRRNAWLGRTRCDADSRSDGMAHESRSLRSVHCVRAEVKRVKAGPKVVFLRICTCLPPFFVQCHRAGGSFSSGDEIFASGECRLQRHRSDFTKWFGSTSEGKISEGRNLVTRRSRMSRWRNEKGKGDDGSPGSLNVTNAA